jgi:curved DNA-binding protein CbpA
MPTDTLDQLDYYTLLGIDASAGEDAVRRAFRKFARKYHPDRFAGAPAEKRERANEIYRRGSEGLQVLCDPDARRLYDVALKKGITRLTAAQREGAARILEKRDQPKKQETVIRSVQARAYYEKARRAIDGKDFRGAWKALKAALAEEPENPIIQRGLAKVDAILRRNL